MVPRPQLLVRAFVDSSRLRSIAFYDFSPYLHGGMKH